MKQKKERLLKSLLVLFLLIHWNIPVFGLPLETSPDPTAISPIHPTVNMAPNVSSVFQVTEEEELVNHSRPSVENSLNAVEEVKTGTGEASQPNPSPNPSSLPLEVLPGDFGSVPVIHRGQGNIPIVDIATPNASGLSHNRYQHFNVDEAGLILNNSKSSIYSRLKGAGEVSPNPHLYQNPARIILNEVLGTSHSQLNGMIEVVGQKADVIIANPNGIYCNGCGFINTGRAVLTTGQPQFGPQGELNAFSVRGGKIQIEKDGLTAESLLRLDLMASELVVKGIIETPSVRSVLGANEVRYHSLQVASTASSKETKETKKTKFAVDVQALGGIRAKEIYLVATEKGLGVNSEGKLTAEGGSIRLTANGDIKLKDTSASDQIKIKSKDKVTLNGKIHGKKGVQVQAIDVETQGADLSSNHIFQIDSDQLTFKKSKLEADKVRIHAKDIAQYASKIAGKGNISLQGEHFYQDKRSEIKSENILSMNGFWMQQEGLLSGDKGLDLRDTQHLIPNLQSRGKLLSAWGDIRIDYSNGLVDLNQIKAGGNVYVNGRQLQGSQPISAIGDIHVSSKEMDLQGISSAKGDVSLEGQTIHLKNETRTEKGNIDIYSQGKVTHLGTIYSGDKINVSADQFEDHAGKILSRGGTQIESQTALFKKSQLQSAGLIKLIIPKQIDLIDSEIQNTPTTPEHLKNLAENAGKISLQSETINLTNSKISGKNGVDIQATQLNQDEKSEITSEGISNLQVKILKNKNLISGQTVQIQSEEIQNAANIISSGLLSLNARLLYNAGQITGKTTKIKAHQVDTQVGKLLGSDFLEIDADILNTSESSTFHSDKNLSLKTKAPNLKGEFVSKGDMMIDIQGPYTHQALFHADGKLNIATFIFENLGKFWGDEVFIDTGNFTNHGGQEIRGNQLKIKSANDINNWGVIYGKHTHLISKIFRNYARVMGDNVSLEFETGANEGSPAHIVVRDRDGVLKLAGNIFYNLSHATLFSLGYILGGRTLKQTGEVEGEMSYFLNRSSTVASRKDMQIRAGKLDNERTQFIVTDTLESIPFNKLLEENTWYTEWGYTHSYIKRWEDGALHRWKRDIVPGGDSGPAVILGRKVVLAGNVKNDKSNIFAAEKPVIIGGYEPITDASGRYWEREDRVYHQRYNLFTGGTDNKDIPIVGQEKTLSSWILAPAHWSGHEVSADLNSLQNVVVSGNPYLTAPYLAAAFAGNPQIPGVILEPIQISDNPLFQYRGLNSPYLYVGDPDIVAGNEDLFAWPEAIYKGLGFDLSKLPRRIGDNFVEQLLLEEQIQKLAGRNLLPGYTSADAQFKALLENTMGFVHAYQLNPLPMSREENLKMSGQMVLLPQGQVAPLTSSIILPVYTTAFLPNGEQVPVLSLQAYLPAYTRIGSLGGIQGDFIDLKVKGDVLNQHLIYANDGLKIVASGDLINTNLLISNKMYVEAHDIYNLGHIAGFGPDNKMVIHAKNNIYLKSLTNDIISDISGNNVLLDAKKIEFVATRVNVEEDFIGRAATSIEISPLELDPIYSQTSQVYGPYGIFTWGETTQQLQASFNVGGTLGFITDGLASITGGKFNVGDWFVIRAKEIKVQPGTTNQEKTILGVNPGGAAVVQQSQTSSIPTEIKSGKLYFSATDDNRLEGVTAIIDGDAYFKSEEGKVYIGPYKESQTVNVAAYSGGKKPTFSINGQSGFIPSPSLIGVKGNFNVSAKTYEQTGSQVFVEKNIQVDAEKIDILSDSITWAMREAVSWSKKSYNAVVNNAFLSATETSKQMLEASQETESNRLKAFAGATGIASVANAITNALQTPISMMNPGSLLNALGGLSFSVNRKKEAGGSYTTTVTQTPAPSTLSGDNIKINAAGKGAESEITIQGSEVTARNKLSFFSEGAINILSSFYTQVTDGISWSKSKSIGLAASTLNQLGISLNANQQSGKGSTTYQEYRPTPSHVEGKTVDMHAEGDLNLIASQLKAEHLIVKVGGDFNIISLQDFTYYKNQYDQKSKSISACVPPICVGSSGASINWEQYIAESGYQGVRLPAGIYVDQGYQIQVNGTTYLLGGIIDSKAPADKNKLSTGALQIEDVKNVAYYKAQQTSFGVGFNPLGVGDGITRNQKGLAEPLSQGIPGYQLLSEKGISPSVPIAMNAKDRKESTTRSAISAADITITDEATHRARTGESSAETLANLNRNPATAHEPLAPIFNEREIRAGFDIVKALTTEVGTFVQFKAKELQNHKDKLEQLLQAEKTGAGVHSEQIGQILELEDKIMDLEKWAPGGTYRQFTTAFTAAASGNVLGTDSQFIQAATVNYLQSLGAEQIKKLSPQLGGEASPVHVALHAILACGGAAAQNQDCGQAAMGASAGVVLNKLLGEAKDLTTEEKEARRNIVSTIVAGVAQAAGSNDVSAALTAAQIETENNFFCYGMTAGRANYISKKWEKCLGDSKCEDGILDQWKLTPEEVVTMISIVPVGKILGGITSKGIKEIFKSVSKGTLKYPKQFENYSKLTDRQLEKAVNSHKKQIAKHKEYIEKPESHVPNWEKLSDRHKENLLYHWRNDIQRHQDYSNLAKEIMKDRGL